MAAGGLTVALAIFPLARPLFVSQRLYEAAAPYLTRKMELATLDYHEPSLVWLFRKKIGGFEIEHELEGRRGLDERPGPRVCVLPADQVKSTFRSPDPAWRVVTAGGFDVANARRVELAAVIKI